MNDNFYNWIMLILALGAALQPFLLGGIFMMMFRFFPTRKEIELQEQSQLARHEENKVRFITIESDIKQLLKRHER